MTKIDATVWFAASELWAFGRSAAGLFEDVDGSGDDERDGAKRDQ